MKTAVSIPDPIFEEAELLARRTNKSRSRLFSDALKEYLARRTPERITEAMDAAIAAIGVDSSAIVNSAAHRILRRSEW
jgi:metal-responsive CopG/Arc/MetJ family transcriptional regulator